MKKIYRGYKDTEVVVLATKIECPHCQGEWKEEDMDECGKTYLIYCHECGKHFEMYFDAD